MKRILSIDGGGALGLIPLTVLKIIENQLGNPINKIFDLIIGTSVGGIIGGVISTGKFTTEDFQKEFICDLPKIFKKRLRIPILQPKYDRTNVEKSIVSKIGNINMSCCSTKFICTSINYVDGKPHFFKSWEDKDGKLKISQALLRSSAAPLYFGKIIDYAENSVWIDGGCGSLNDPAMQGYIEALRQDWLPNERVHLLSIGCGQTFKGIPFNKCSTFNNIKEVAYYLDINDGGLARAQMSMVQDEWLNSFSKEFSKFTAQRIQKYDFPKKLNKLDNVNNIPEFIKIGEEISKDVDYTYLRN